MSYAAHKSSPHHNLGLQGNFAISPALQDAAYAYGFAIERRQKNEYRLMHPSGEAARNILPAAGLQGDGLTARDLKGALEFLQQPIKATIASMEDVKNPHEARVMAVQIFELLSKGSVQIATAETNAPPRGHDEEDHTEIETDMRIEDRWRDAPEIGDGGLTRGRYDPSMHSYAFTLSSAGAPDEIPSHTALRAMVNECLESFGHKALEPIHGVLYLSGKEMETLVREITSKADQFAPLIERAHYDEQVRSAVRCVEKARSEHSVTEAAQLHSPSLEALAQTSSALSAILRDDVMVDSWNHYHFFDRGKSPVPGILMEIGVFEGVLAHYHEKGGASASEIKAIEETFRPLLLLTRDMLKTLDEAAYNAKQDISADFRDALTQSLQFEGKLKEPDYKELVSTAKKSLGLVGPVRQNVEAGACASKGFFTDITSFMKESPGQGVAALSVAGLLYLASQSTSINPEIMQRVNEIPEESVLMLTDEGLEPVEYDMSSLPAEATARQMWHPDANLMGWAMQSLQGDWSQPIGVYKHYTIDLAVTAPTEKAVDGFEDWAKNTYNLLNVPYDPDNSFIQSAKETIQPTANVLFHANIFQNLTHAGFWVYMFGKGRKHGLSGSKRLLQFLTPVGNLLRSGLNRVAEALRFKKPARLSERLMAMAQGPEVSPQSDTGRTSPLYIPSRRTALTKKWALAAGGACAAGAAASVGMDMAGMQNSFADLGGSFNGAAYTAGIAGTAFLIYNVADDILLNHIGGGAVALLQGAGLRAAYDKAIKPTWRYMKEKKRNVLSMRSLDGFKPGFIP